MPALAQASTVGIVEFRRERPLAHPGRVGLHDAQDEVDGAGADARPGGRLPGDHVGRGHEGIGAEVDVEERALRAFEEDAAAGAAALVQDLPDGGGIGQHSGGDLLQRGEEGGAVHRLQPEAAAERVVMDQGAVDPGLEGGAVGQVGHADGAPPHLVLVGRADATAGRADAGHGVLALAGAVKLPVDGQNERRVLGDHQGLGGDLHVLVPKLGDLVAQVPGVEHHAVADDRELAAPDDARRQERELEDLAVDDQCVAGVVTALEPSDHVCPFRQPIDDLALPLVAPLGADDDDVGHDASPLRKVRPPLARRALGRNRAIHAVATPLGLVHGRISVPVDGSTHRPRDLRRCAAPST
ncbi:MAG: hypothetical protein AAF390_03785 [Pseudomonadota bacterium]